MERDKMIWEELNELSLTVAAIGNRNVFSVPNGYFDGLTENVLLSVSEEMPLNIPHKMPFAVPEGYFDSLADNVLKAVKAKSFSNNEIWNELQEIAPLLNTISKQPVYTMPAGYFDELRFELPGSKAKVIPFTRTKRFIRYIAAAVIIAVVAITGVLFLREPAPTKNTAIASEQIQQELKNVPESEIMDELNTYNSAADVIAAEAAETSVNTEPGDLMNGVSKEDMIEFLNENQEPGDPGA